MSLFDRLTALPGVARLGLGRGRGTSATRLVAVGDTPRESVPEPLPKGIPSLAEARSMRPATSHRMPLPVELYGIHHVVIAIPEGGEETARDFWSTVMGMKEVTKPPHLAGHGVWLRGEDVEVHCPPVSPFTPQVDDPPAFLVPDAEYAVRQLTAHGIQASVATKEWPGWVRAVLTDPFGNRLRLVSRAPDDAA